MSEQIRIIIGDNGTAFARCFSIHMRKRGCICSARRQTAQNLLRAIRQDDPDVIILDITQKYEDYFSLLKELRAHSNALFFAVTAASNSYLEQQLWQEGLLNIWRKPVDESAVLREIVACLSKVSLSCGTNELSLEALITELLRAVGVPANMRGYQFLRHGILLSLWDPSLIYQITKGIYSNIARTFHVSIAGVERGIRAALEAAWNNTSRHIISEALGCPLHYVRNRLSNAEFIAIAVDRLMLDRRVKALLARKTG